MNYPSNISKCKIAVDAMGGDFAPRNAVVGAINAYDESKQFDLLLVGRENEIQDVINSENIQFSNENIINADDVGFISADIRFS